MTLRALDTNVLLRYLTADDLEQSPRAQRLFDRELYSSDELLITIPVVCELTWLLGSRRYRFNREQIAAAWDLLLSSRRFRFQARAHVVKALAHFKVGPADLSDYLILYLSQAEGALEVVTFDRDFATADGVTQVP